ncbi:hypothetical protein ACQPZF_02880 [Actinosynnema sp. CS-041913]|uniref:hypothetical protein n=1 Tax=Actinosynnema sp. CS-041913 TaxID=3239917 RepID=UPI003D8E5F06
MCATPALPHAQVLVLAEELDAALRPDKSGNDRTRYPDQQRSHGPKCGVAVDTGDRWLLHADVEVPAAAHCSRTRLSN